MKGPALEKPAHMHRGTRHLEVLEGADRTFAFGRVESGDKELGANERVAVSIRGEMAGNGNGDVRGNDDGEDSTRNGGTIDSARIKATRLTGEVCQHQRSRIKNLRVVWATYLIRRASVLSL